MLDLCIVVTAALLLEFELARFGLESSSIVGTMSFQLIMVGGQPVLVGRRLRGNERNRNTEPARSAPLNRLQNSDMRVVIKT